MAILVGDCHVVLRTARNDGGGIIGEVDCFAALAMTVVELLGESDFFATLAMTVNFASNGDESELWHSYSLHLIGNLFSLQSLTFLKGLRLVCFRILCLWPMFQQVQKCLLQILFYGPTNSVGLLIHC